MPEISSVVQVNIDRQTAVITQEGFGTLLVMAPHVAFPERIRTFETPSGYQNLFPAGDAIRIACDAAFAQNPRIERVKIGRQQVDSVVVNVVTVANDTTYQVTIGGLTIPETTISYTSDSDATFLEIAAGLVAAINANGVISPLVTAVDNLDGTFNVNVDVAGTPFTVKPGALLEFIYATATGRGSLNSLTPVASESGSSIANALTAIEAEDRDWYGISMVSIVASEVLVVAAYTETKRKIFGTTSEDVNIINQSFSVDTTSVAKQLALLAYSRTWTIYSATSEQFPECAWFGKMLPTAPGSSNWKFKTLAGVTVDNLTDTQIANAESKNANTYVAIGGINMTQQGVVAEPEFIDTMIFIDWLAARMSERVFSVLVNLPKVPFTDAGIASLEAEVRAQLQDGIAVGGLADDPQPTVTSPAALDVPAQDRAARRLVAPNNIKFTCRIAGALNNIDIDGTVTV